MDALTRVSEYRRLLAELPDEAVGVVVACFVFSSIHHKRRAAQAMAAFESDPGFAGWGTVKGRPEAGCPAVVIPVPPRRSPRAARRER